MTAIAITPDSELNLAPSPKAPKPKTASHLLTYKTREAAIADRNQQLRLLEILDAISSALRRDECGAWRINGRKGLVYTWGDDETWVAYIAPGTSIRWTKLKQRLNFCQVTQNGDDEGCLRFGPSLSAEQGKLLRKAFGLKKRIVLSPEHRDRLVSMQRRFVRGEISSLRPETAETPSKVPNPPPTLSTEISRLPDTLEPAHVGD